MNCSINNYDKNGKGWSGNGVYRFISFENSLYTIYEDNVYQIAMY